MKYVDFLDNPIEWIVNLLKSMATHDIEWILLVVGALFLVFIIKELVEFVKEFMEHILSFAISSFKRVDMLCQIHRIKKHYKRKLSEREKNILISKDIDRHIKKLHETKDNYASIQYLLTYPSKKGFQAIFDLAFTEDDDETICKYLCLLCKNSSKGKWYT